MSLAEAAAAYTPITVMLSPSKHLVAARHLRSFLNFLGRFRAHLCDGTGRPLGWWDSVLVAEREPESSEEEESGMSAATVSQAYPPSTGSSYTQRYEDVRPGANAWRHRLHPRTNKSN